MYTTIEQYIRYIKSQVKDQEVRTKLCGLQYQIVDSLQLVHGFLKTGETDEALKILEGLLTTDEIAESSQSVEKHRKSQARRARREQRLKNSKSVDNPES